MTGNAARPKAGAVLTAIIKALEIFSSAALLIMMLLTFVDVVGRYIFSAPIFGASEMISFLLALVIFSGLGIANARDRHIVVELFDANVRKHAPKTYDMIVNGFSICAMTLIAYVLFEIALETREQNARTFVLEWPLYYITGAISFLAIVSVISQVLGLLSREKDDENQVREDT
ncbi:MAG: TRAP transporter small permease [Stappiaceae bacterium]